MSAGEAAPGIQRPPVDPRRVQQALVCMLFDPALAARISGPGPLAADDPPLDAGERALLRGVDPRALATDHMRRARALQVILEEYPVSAAVVGVDWVDRFFASPAFRRCVCARGAMALAFAEYLGNRAKGVGTIEAAMAAARRQHQGRDRDREVPAGTLVRPARIVPLVVPAGTLAWYQRTLAKLGAEPLQALAKRRRPGTEQPPRRSSESLLLELEADGSVNLGGASAALVGLLQAAAEPRPRSELAAVAVELGAEAHEAEGLLDDLIGEGLLSA